jgi:hypothetical protein
MWQDRAFPPYARVRVTPIIRSPATSATGPRKERRLKGKKIDTGAGKDDEPVVIETKPGHHKDIGGGESDKWNFRQMQLVLSALPGASARDKKSAGEIGSGVISGLMDVKPNDPMRGC